MNDNKYYVMLDEEWVSDLYVGNDLNEAVATFDSWVKDGFSVRFFINDEEVNYYER